MRRPYEVLRLRSLFSGVTNGAKMEVFVVAPSFRCSSFDISHQDWYVTSNGRLSGLEERLQDGAVYRLEPRLRGGKGGQFPGIWSLLAELIRTRPVHHQNQNQTGFHDPAPHPDSAVSSSTASAAPTARTSEVQNPSLPTEPAEVQKPSLPTEPAEVQKPSLPTEPAEVQKPAHPTEPAVEPSGDQNPPRGCREPDQSRTLCWVLTVLVLPQQLDLSSVPSVQQLESLGLEVLKEELMRRGLKCGGTLSERAARLFSIRGLSPDRVDPALLARTRRK
uniref:SDE2 telomere maintenance homolog n=1 Tax=Poecilia reticulata TaxID=8081 RepID=A0A3P9NFF6_POERE